MAKLEFKNVYKQYPNGKKAITDVSLKSDSKEFIVVVGPSGCGKTTLLRLVAGLEQATDGEIYINGLAADKLKPQDRSVTLVFQNYALFPYMTAYENMEFGLKIAGIDKEIRSQKVIEAAKILGIENELGSKPRELSGGQRQRVALGRAMVMNPQFFLFDEPLSNLDAGLRSEMRVQIRDMFDKSDATFIYVTHDKTEALTMGTKIAVLNDGKLEQFDTPDNVYERPINKFVASFMDTDMNFFDGTLENGIISLLGKQFKTDIRCDESRDIIVGIRPEDIILVEHGDLNAEVKSLERIGRESTIFAFVNRQKVIIKTTEKVGKDISIAFDESKLHVFCSKTGQRIN